MTTSRLNVFDQDTLNALNSHGVPDEIIRRVVVAMDESTTAHELSEKVTNQAEQISDLRREIHELMHELERPRIAWVIPLDYAEKLHDHLHRTMPGGYQEYHDALAEAIAVAR